MYVRNVPQVVVTEDLKANLLKIRQNLVARTIESKVQKKVSREFYLPNVRSALVSKCIVDFAAEEGDGREEST